MDNKDAYYVVLCRRIVVLLALPGLVLGLAVSPADAQPSVQGQWVKPIGGTGDGYGWPLNSRDAALLSTGKVLVWDANSGDIHDAKLWNPADGSFTEVDCSVCVGTLHCAGHAFLADGSLLVYRHT